MAATNLAFLPTDPTRRVPIVGSLLGTIIKLAHKISIKVKDVKANRRQCLRLSERIQRVAAYLQTYEFKKMIYSYGGALQQTLEAFIYF